MSNPTVREISNTPAGASAPSARTVVKRRPARAVYERDAIHAILDEAFFCHVGFVHQGSPRIIPCVYARQGDVLYLHGSTANRMLRSITTGEVCITVTLLDGLVLARSAFHNSVSYRSVVIYGRGEAVTNGEEKLAALKRTVEHVIPGRWKEVRQPSREELLQTLVVRVPLAEASAKIRLGDPIDEEADHALDCWAGVIPMRLAAQDPVADALLRPGIPVPAYATAYSRTRPR